MTANTAPPPRAGGGAIAEFFKFAERGTDLATEAKAGLTTFMVMAYILLVNPSILANMFGAPGSPEAQAFIPAAAAATALVAGLLTIAMGVFANVPIALAAGLAGTRSSAIWSLWPWRRRAGPGSCWA